MNPQIRPPNRERGRKVEVEWTTVSYRTIAIYAFLACLLAFGIVYFISPQFVVRMATRALETVAASPSAPQKSTSRREAHFVNLDGNVRIKKIGSLMWMRADYNTSLEKGDFVQTGNDGVAR